MYICVYRVQMNNKCIYDNDHDNNNDAKELE